jgi:hypothetical protein
MTQTFSNMAGKKDIDDLLAAELTSADIEVLRLQFLKDGRREVDTSVRGSLHGWGFTRAWYYWVAEGPGLPPSYATPLHETHGRDVRVEGDCGSPSPMEARKGFAIGLYHVDTADGLKALADTLRLVVSDAARATEGEAP